jgi:hypothetical protein
VLNFYINNAGGCRLRIDSVSIAAGSDPGFAIPPPPVFPQIIQPGESLAVPVLFNPPAPAGPRHATIEVSAANDPLHPMPLTISANGIGLSPTISATPGSTFFAPTVVSCSRTQAITIFNTGPAELIVDNASVAGAGYSLDPVVLPIRLAPNASTELNVRFAPPSIARRFDGTLTLASDDLATPSKLVSFCGEGAPIGIRVLVLQADGTPYSTVDQITLSSYGVRPNASTSVRDAPLTAISPPASCQTIRYHYETALPATETSDTRGSYYNVKAKVGNKAQSVSFTLGECEFKEIVLALRSRDDPMLLNASRDGTAFTFSLATEPSVTCTVETTDSLSAPNWQPLQTLLGDGTVMTVRDSITNASQKYYRVKVE